MIITEVLVGYLIRNVKRLRQMKMYSYIVVYDLCKPDRDYQSLYEMLRSFPNWGKITESVWCIVSPLSHKDVRDKLMACLDSNDRLLVVETGRCAAWTNVIADNEWVRKYIIQDEGVV